MFSDIKTIKKLTLHNEDEGNEFPKDADWKLEELNMYIECFNDELDSSFKKFLESQKSTLKVLRHDCSVELCSFIMHNFPDLELLHLQIKSDTHFCNQLKPNEKLKSLSLYNFPDDDDKSLEKILRHYKNIHYLNIRPYGDGMFGNMYEGRLIPKNVELLNLTHLSFYDFVGSFLDSVRMPNLKCLEISIDGDLYSNFDDIYLQELAFNAENLANVEKLSIDGLSMKNITKIIEMCPKLQHLNLIGIPSYDSDSDNSDSCCEEHQMTGLKTLVRKAPQLKIIGGLGDKDWQKEVEDVFAKLNRKVTIKNYEVFTDMMADYWPLGMIGDFEYFSSKFY
jgi:hypothetical protein